MNDDSGNLADRSGTAERPLIDSAWSQFESMTRRDQYVPNDHRRSLDLPGYRILREIHRGGQGVIYQAMQNSTQRKVAIKILREGPLAEQTELARFDREVEVLSRLSHPHIVTIHDRGLAAGHAYFVMDFIPGRPLDAYVAGEVLSTPAVLSLFRKICEAVNVAHLRGVIHRDLKPGNIRIDEDGEPHVLDFGLAKFVRETGSSAEGMTRTGNFVGSLPWASPEQAAGRSDLLDIRTDVYSLGVILFQLLAGRFPYPVSGPIDEVLRNIIHTSPARPSTLTARIDRDVEVILLKALAKDPDRRYQSAGDLARDIQRYLDGEPIEARPATALYQFRQFARRNRTLVASAMAVILILAAATTVSVVFAIRAAAARDRERSALGREVEERRRADREASQTRAVADFQAQMLSDIDPQTMGTRLRADLLAKARAAAEGSGRTPEEIDARLEELEEHIAGIDLAGLALTALDENVFRRALETIEEKFADQPVIQAQLLQTVADTERDLGLLEAATQPQEQALTIRRRVLGDEHPDTLASINQMGVLLQVRGRSAEAEVYCREALESRSRVLGEAHPDTLSSMSNVGDLLRSQGKLAEAGSYCREALKNRRRVLGDEHPDTLSSLQKMGILLRDQGKLAEAEPYYRETLESRRRVLGDEHVETLSSMSNFANLLLSLGKLSEAEPYFHEALEKRRRVLGAEHPDTLVSIAGMGTLLDAQGERAKAEPYYREALAKCRRVFGNEHPNTLTSINYMGKVLQALGQPAEAELYMREALETRRRVLGEEHPSTLISVNDMGLVLQAQNKLAEAEPYCLEALEKNRRLLGEEHPHTLNSINNFAVLLRAQGRLAEAEPFCREALEKRRRVLGDEHPNTLNSINNLAMVLRDQNKLDEAEPYYREALDKRRRVQGDGHPDTLVSLNNLAMLLKAQNRLPEAETYCREALEKSRRVLGDEHPSTLATVGNMGGLLQAQGRPAEVIELLAETEMAARRALTGGHAARLGRHLRALGCARAAVGQFDAAQENLTEADAILCESMGATEQDRTAVRKCLVELYDAWHASAPDNGYDAKAAEWRAHLAE